MNNKKSIISIILIVILTINFIGCSSQDDFSNSITIDENNYSATIGAFDMLLNLISENVNENQEVRDVYETLCELLKDQKSNKYFYDEMLNGNSPTIIEWGDSYVRSTLNSEILGRFEDITRDREEYISTVDKIMIFASEMFYKNINFNEYKRLMLNTSNKDYLNSLTTIYSDDADYIKRELDLINSKNLFNIEIEKWSKKQLKDINKYHDIYMQFYNLYTLRSEMDNLVLELSDPSININVRMNKFISETTNLLSQYELGMQKLPGIEIIIEDMLKASMGEEAAKIYDVKDLVESLINDEFTLSQFIEEQALDMLPSYLSAPVYISGSIVNLINNNISNERLAVQFGLYYMFGDYLPDDKPIDIVNYIKYQEYIPNELSGLYDEIGNYLNTSLNGNLAGASEEDLKNLYSIVEELKKL